MPLLWLSLAFLTGSGVAAAVSIPFAIWITMAAASFVLLIPPFNRIVARLIPSGLPCLSGKAYLSNRTLFPLLLLLISLGAIRYIATRPAITPEFIAYYNDQPAYFNLEGVVVEPPDLRDTYTNLRVRVEQLKQGDEELFIQVGGLVLIRLTSGDKFQYGDRVRVQGHIQTPAENEEFSFRNYLAHQGIYSSMASNDISLVNRGNGSPVLAVIYNFQQSALDLTYRLLPDPEASLVAGIVLGVRSGIPNEVQEAFRLTGTSHIIVISGYNIAIIAAFFSLLFRRLAGERNGALISAIAIILYTLLVGANPAVVRAAILGMLSLLSRQVGRQQTGLNSLAFIAAIMALITPTILWDVSFQLSFAATLGIMLYTEPFTQAFTSLAARFLGREKAERLAGPVGEYFCLTLAAQITTLPLLVYYFRRISVISLIANPLILPAQPALMMLGGLCVLFGFVSHPIGQLLAWMTWPFAAYTIRMVEWLAKIPYASLALGQVALPIILGFYAGIFLVTATYKRLSNLLSRLSPAIPLTILLALTVLIWKEAYSAPDGKLHVTVMNVGTGEAVLIQSPSGRNVLLNGGESTNQLSDALGRKLSPLRRSLDWLAVADIDNEDLAGLPDNLERFKPNNVLWAGNTYGTRAASELWGEITAQSIPITMMQPGQKLDLGSGAFLEVISTNSRGAVLHLEWIRFKMLLPMGMDVQALENLEHNSSMRNISAMLLAESGYAPLNPPKLINQLHPQLALISVAAGDKTGLPSPETIQALEGYSLLRTDVNGWLMLTTDGRHMWVEAERK